MLEQSGNSIIFYAHYIKDQVGSTGLTVTVDVWEVTRAGAATEIVTGGSATEIGDGLYRYLLAAGSVDADAEYIAVFKTADADVDQRDIPALWAINRAGIEYLDASIATVDTVVDAILADTGTDGVAISTTVKQSIADEILKRGIGNVEDAADATSLAGLVLAAFESAISDATWTIKKTDGTTFTTKTLTFDDTADPIVSVT